uniref:stizolobate synthase n=1 Tax=Fenestraria rhopalophylla subsp. aurantiaca TaxID=215965 RepID=A0A5B8XAI1_9CARY|nr:4,5-dioxygenase-like protein [Fenestraria rhopalophylla subsp. aurantiaca]
MWHVGNPGHTLKRTPYLGIVSPCSSVLKRRTKPNLICVCKMDSVDKIAETFYISHGTPRMSIDETIPARRFLEDWKEKVYSKRPRSILVITAHWETVVPTVNAIDHSDLIYDFRGFPARMYQLKYPAPGAPDLAKKVQELLAASGFECAVDKKRGLDHGSWVPLLLMYPEANIPVCQLSVQPHLEGTHHYNLGRALAPLKEEGVLVIGSGSAVHPANNTPHCVDGVAPWAAEFDNWLEEALTDGRYEDVNNYTKKAPNWKIAHPWPEHFYPLHVAIGAAGENSKAELIHRSWDHGTLGYASYKFTST